MPCTGTCPLIGKTALVTLDLDCGGSPVEIKGRAYNIREEASVDEVPLFGASRFVKHCVSNVRVTGSITVVIHGAADILRAGQKYDAVFQLGRAVGDPTFSMEIIISSTDLPVDSSGGHITQNVDFVANTDPVQGTVAAE